MELQSLRHLHVVLLQFVQRQLLIRNGDFVDLKYKDILCYWFILRNELLQRTTARLSKGSRQCHELLIMWSLIEDLLNILSEYYYKITRNLIFISSIIVSLSSRMKNFSLSSFKSFLSHTKSRNRPGVLLYTKKQFKFKKETQQQSKALSSLAPADSQSLDHHHRKSTPLSVISCIFRVSRIHFLPIIILIISVTC
jgi:hypothetical protein